MKIPVIDEAGGQTSALPTVLDKTDNTGLGKAVAGAGQSFGDALGGIEDEYRQHYEKLKQQNQAAGVIAALNATQKEVDMGLNDRDIGLLNQPGEKAVAMSAGFFQRLQQRRDQIAQSFNLDPEQQKVFQQRSNGMLEDAYRTGEKHVSQQIRVSNEADLQASQSLTLDHIAQFSGDDELVSRSTAAVEANIRSQQPTKLAGDAAVAKWRGEVAQTVLNSRISSGDVNGAQSYLDRWDVRESLGHLASHFEQTLSTKRAQIGGAQDAQRILQDSSTVSAGGLRNIDEAKVAKAVEALPPGQQREVAEQEFNRLRALNDKGNAQMKADWYAKAYAAYYDGGQRVSAVPADVMTNLIHEDPEGHHKLMSVVEQDQERALRGYHERVNARPSPEQTAAYVKLTNDMAEHPEKYRDMDANQFARANQYALANQDFKSAGEKLAHLKQTPEKDLHLTGIAERALTEISAHVFDEPKDNRDSWSAEHQAAWADAYDEVKTQAAVWAKDHHGKTPGLEQYQEWANKALEGGVVKDTGFFRDDRTTRAEYRTNPKYKGKTFVPNGAPTDSVPAQPQSQSKQAAPARAYQPQKGNDGHMYQWDPGKKAFTRVD